MQKIKTVTIGILALAALGIMAQPAAAGDDHGDFMVRGLVTGVLPETDAAVYAGGRRIPGAGAEVSDEIIPAATLTYFFTDNLAVELFCCFAKHDVNATGSIAALGEIADTWIFPPALTAQYHFNPGGKFQPYAGVGLQYIAFFDEGKGSNLLGASSVDIDDALGFTLQLGMDYSLGNGWFLNADVKKTWIDTDVKWTGTGISGDVDLDPWIVSAGVGYRFNLSDVLGGL
ncbi:Outer membrane protein W precursor [Methyloligella halotolerans]|uniref:Outer membrane protein W n=1 Tax=Methyloligella halotolerans TaxID=1177755 RepID=A0A1E2S2G4_9HYPH|nr:OmpW family outer membrane protein [Methyloligella halotolerans]ODA68703.1 Outer membrane protein W precursor [Methyloligella halotolerans]